MPYPSETESALGELKDRFGRLADLGQVGDLLAWDRQTYMPAAAGATRGRQMATLNTVIHGMIAERRVGELLDRLEEARLEADDAVLVRLCRREYDEAVKLPSAFVERLTTARSRASDAWLAARKANDYGLFAPHLATMFELARERAEHLGYEEHPYDALHDSFEHGSTVARVKTLFDRLRPHLTALVARIAERGERRNGLLYGEFDPQLQDRFARRQVELFGFDFDAGRLDLTVHPFAQGVGQGDTRITTRYRSDYLGTGIFAAFHEAGHGMYEQGLPARWNRLPLGQAVSLGVHESQSRLWENLVGRSLAFWRGAFPQLQELFPGSLGGVSVEEFHRSVNSVEPSLIRIEADEVTYNLHVLIRFELELALLEGDLEAAELPEAWNHLYRDYLGVEPGDDLTGCLQDVHWSHGLIGYFPTYTLGNVMSVQLFDAMRTRVPRIDMHVEQGQFEPIAGWLRDEVHAHGSRYEPDELLKLATGQSLDPEPYLRYLDAKFGDLYDLEVPA